jgi:biotin carboxyl carrier protein
VQVVSPVVGTFLNGGGLKGQRTIAVGDRLARGTLLATIESMKVPNEVRSPVDGEVTAVLVEDGAPVEYGQMLFTIAPEEDGATDESDAPVGLA